jgi:tryptophan-rich sensory protein
LGGEVYFLIAPRFFFFSSFLFISFPASFHFPPFFPLPFPTFSAVWVMIHDGRGWSGVLVFVERERREERGGRREKLGEKERLSEMKSIKVQIGKVVP